RPDLKLSCRVIQLSQVILNLLGNSHDAICEQTVGKWIKVEVSETGSGSQDMVCIRITDSGKRISDDLIGKIMQPFFTTKEVGKGTGLGLSISKGIIESHGGTL